MNAVVLDIEGTTTPLSFVHDVLFTYAREQLPAFMRRNRDRDAVIAMLAALRTEFIRDPAVPADLRGALDDLTLQRYALWLIDEDRKSTPLKALQGAIWAEGYRNGELVGELYPDVPDALREWRAAGTHVAIFSSGSVLAQQLLFRHSRFGDLSELIGAYFDTNVGAKRDATSYASIAESLRTEPARCLFASDTEAELEAARAAGLSTALCVREGQPADSAAGERVITELTELSRGVAAC